MINRWDRPGRHALELMDEIQSRIGLRPTPLTWPVGIAGDFKGVLDRRNGNFIRFTPRPRCEELDGVGKSGRQHRGRRHRGPRRAHRGSRRARRRRG